MATCSCEACELTMTGLGERWIWSEDDHRYMVNFCPQCGDKLSGTVEPRADLVRDAERFRKLEGETIDGNGGDGYYMDHGSFRTLAAGADALPEPEGGA